jgi:hypothetical protein
VGGRARSVQWIMWFGHRLFSSLPSTAPVRTPSYPTRGPPLASSEYRALYTFSDCNGILTIRRSRAQGQFCASRSAGSGTSSNYCGLRVLETTPCVGRGEPGSLVEHRTQMVTGTGQSGVIPFHPGSNRPGGVLAVRGGCMLEPSPAERRHSTWPSPSQEGAGYGNRCDYFTEPTALPPRE